MYNTFGEAEAARPAGQYRKYAAAVAGAWAVLFVAAVLVIGESQGKQFSRLGAGTRLFEAAPAAAEVACRYWAADGSHTQSCVFCEL